MMEAKKGEEKKKNRFMDDLFVQLLLHPYPVPRPSLRQGSGGRDLLSETILRV